MSLVYKFIVRFPLDSALFLTHFEFAGKRSFFLSSSHFLYARLDRSFSSCPSSITITKASQKVLLTSSDLSGVVPWPSWPEGDRVRSQPSIPLGPLVSSSILLSLRLM